MNTPVLSTIIRSLAGKFGTPASRRRQSRRLFSSIEFLETRALMSVTIAANSKSATYTDVDGDLVTVAITVGTLTGANFTTAITGAGDQLRVIDLSGGGFDGTNLTVTVKKGVNGDGQANIGYINSSGHDMGTVSVLGDLGRIDAGDSTAATPGLKSLTVQSLGRQGLDTQGGTGSLVSNIVGALTTLVVKDDIAGAEVSVTGVAEGKIGSISVTGSLIGGDADHSGEVHSTGDIGTVKIGRDLQGGSGIQSGTVRSDSGKMGNTTIGGSMIGASGSLSGTLFAGSDIGTVTVSHDIQGGDGLFSGYINAGGKLGNVTVNGSIIGGNGANSGQVVSTSDMGAVKIGHNVEGAGGDFSGAIQSTSGKIASVTIGGTLAGSTGISSGFIFAFSDLGAIKITRDIQGGTGAAPGAINGSGKLASLSVGGSIIGGDADNSGQVKVSLDIGAVSVSGDIRGGQGGVTGFVSSSGGKIASLTIGGSLIGGGNHDSGKVSSAGTMGTVKITHNIQGGSGINSGEILTGAGTIASVSIGGSLIGGSGNSSGDILCGAALGNVTIAHDLQGGNLNSTNSLDQTGCIIAVGRISAITVSGSIFAGINTSTGALTASGSIRAGDDIGSLTVKGSIIGNHNATSNTAVVISARGQVTQGATTDLAIGKITVSGRVEFTNFMAGYGITLNVLNADAQIGAVAVTGDWIGSNLVAGTMNVASLNTKFGDGNDAKISGGLSTDNAGILSKITSITIKGAVVGTPFSSDATDQYGFVAESIGSLKVLNVTIVLNSAAHTDNLAVGLSTDMNLHEV